MKALQIVLIITSSYLSHISLVSAESEKGMVEDGFLLNELKAVSSRNPQDVVSQCVSIFDKRVLDRNLVIDKRSHFETYSDWMCSSSFEKYEEMKSSSSKFGMSLPLAEGLLGLDAESKADASKFKVKYAKFCASTYSDFASNRYLYNYMEKVGESVAAAFNHCLSNAKDILLGQQGIFVYAIPENQNLTKILVNVEYKDKSGSSLKIKSVEGSVDCTLDGKPLTKQTIKEHEFVATCEKPSDRTAKIAFNTNLGKTRIMSVPGVDELDRELIKDRLLQLESSLARDFDVVADLKTESNVHGPETGRPTAGTGFVSCPDGSFVAGIRGIDIDQGRFCVNCISQVQIICKKL